MSGDFTRKPRIRKGTHWSSPKRTELLTLARDRQRRSVHEHAHLPVVVPCVCVPVQALPPGNRIDRGQLVAPAHNVGFFLERSAVTLGIVLALFTDFVLLDPFKTENV